MKNIIILPLILLWSLCSIAQQPKPAEKGVTYGSGAIAQNAIAVNNITGTMKDGKFVGAAMGKVVAVCMEKGCWMKIEKAEGETMMVKFVDYSFFMPQNIVGKEVIIDGEAAIKETSVKQLKHYAKDEGKSEAEISKIKTPKKELIFVAKGVLVL